MYPEIVQHSSEGFRATLATFFLIWIKLVTAFIWVAIAYSIYYNILCIIPHMYCILFKINHLYQSYCILLVYKFFQEVCKFIWNVYESSSTIQPTCVWSSYDLFDSSLLMIGKSAVIHCFAIHCMWIMLHHLLFILFGCVLWFMWWIYEFEKNLYDIKNHYSYVLHFFDEYDFFLLCITAKVVWICMPCTQCIPFFPCLPYI